LRSRTALSVVLLLDVGHESTRRLAHLADAGVVGAVRGADRPAVDGIAVAATRLQALAAGDQAVDRRHAPSAETALLPDARVANICRVHIAAGRRAGEEAGGGER